MSKNLTRKGLALGALVALTSTVIAGTPAMAAGELVVAPSAGTSYNALAGTVFNLKTTFAPGSTPSSYAQLKYVVTTDANSAVTYDLGTSAVAAPATSVAASTTAVTAATSGASAVSVNYIGLKATTSSVTAAVTVTAFVDANNDNALTAGEWNTVKTVTFKKVADVTPVVTVTPATAGDTSAKATVAWGDLNVEQINASNSYAVTTGTTNSALGVDIKIASGSYAAATYSSTTGVFTLTGAVAATNVISAQAVYATNTFDATPDPDTNVRTTVALGTAATATAVARSINTVNGLVANVVAGSDSVATAATAVATATAAVVRTNGTFTTQVKAYDISAGATTASTVVKSGVAVTASVSGTFATALRPASTGVTEISVTVNGTKYTTNATLAAASVALTTDASGVASVVVSSTGLSAADKITVSFTGQNVTAGVEATQTAATFTVVSTAVGSALRSIVEGGSTTINYSVKDQFGVAITGGARLKTVVGYSTPVTSYVNLVNGAASVTVTDTTASTDADITVDAGLQTQDATTLNWSPDTTTVNAAQQTVYVTATALSFDTVPVAQSIALSTSVALTTSSVTNPGAAVTVAAKGFIFTVNSVEYTDTVTLFAGANGDVVVSAKSNTSGAQTVTFTAGTDVKTAVVTVAAPASSAGKSIDLSTVPATIVPGSTLVITGFVKDAYGNGVPAAATSPSTFSVVYTGPGFIVGGSTPTTTDSTGKFTFTVILGVNDSGSATVAVKYDADGATTTVAEISKSATIAIAKAVPPVVTPAAAASGSTAKFYVSVVNAAGKTVVVKVGGKFVRSFIGATAKKVVAIASAKGSKSVTVFVGGKLVLTKTVSVK